MSGPHKGYSALPTRARTGSALQMCVWHFGNLFCLSEICLKVSLCNFKPDVPDQIESNRIDIAIAHLHCLKMC